ncbi:unnamed protein product [Gongylonema pulchrum]|uniref:Tetraspanin n=1 Tax=Gongylonema pulchrum TaxID=637853 RepID=A0A183EMN6_9BILA|nr:unnamed protein product [Gongylonema pulchrum]
MARCFLDYGVQKRSFFLCNAVLWLLGLGSLLVGIWWYMAKRDYVDFIPPGYGTISAVGFCVAAGLIAILITFVGCFGVWMKSRMFLLTYTLLTVLLMMAQAVVCYLTLSYQPDVYDRARSDMEQSLLRNGYRDEVFLNSHLTWDEMQKVFHCCGINGPADWFGNQRWPNSDYVPDSCCNELRFSSNSSMDHCGKGKENWDLWYQQVSIFIVHFLLKQLHKMRIVVILFVHLFVLYRPHFVWSFQLNNHGCGEVYVGWLFEELKIVAYIAMAFLLVEVRLLVGYLSRT